MKVVVDTGPLVAAAHARERAHRVAAALIHRLARDLIIPLPVLTEADHLIRSRLGARSARLLLRAVSAGAHEVAYLSPGLLKRAVELDTRHADLGLGLVDTSVMAVAENLALPVFTFDFNHFRAAPSDSGPWQMLLTEAQLREALE